MQRNKYLEQEKIAKRSLRIKGAAGNILLEPSPVLKELKCLKKYLMINASHWIPQDVAGAEVVGLLPEKKFLTGSALERKVCYRQKS